MRVITKLLFILLLCAPVMAQSPANVKRVAVSGLPAAAENTGKTYVVTDGSTTSDCTVGTGSLKVRCTSDGSNWVSDGTDYATKTLQVNGHALNGDVTVSKSDVGLGSVENTALSTWVGTTNITTLGTIASGAWAGTTIPLNKGGSGQTTANAAFNAFAPSKVGNALKALRVNADETDYELFTLAGGGDALVANPLSQFAATTSLQLFGVITNPTGSGALVFGTAPNITAPTGIVKGDVGLGSVDNTSDAGKPVSTAQQTALDLKANLAGPIFTGTPTLPSGTIASGSFLTTNIAAPSTPASGKTSTFVDSTDKRFHDKNDAGTIGTTVVADAGASNNFLTAISAAGAISKAQPSFSNISGTVAASQLPNPTSSTLGGVQSLAALSHQWINTISTAGVPAASQPASSDLSDTSNLPLINAANVFSSATGQSMKKLLLPGATSGTLTVLAAAAAGSSTLTLPGGTTDFSATGGTSQVVKQTAAGGALTVAQLACADLSNAAASCATDATNAANIGSGTLPAGRMPAHTGDVTTSAGAVATTIAAGAVSAGKVDSTVKGVGTVSTASVNGTATTDVQMLQLTLPAGYLNTASQVAHIRASGTWTTGTTQTPTQNFKVKLCTVSGCGSGTALTLISTTGAAATASTVETWIIQVDLGTVSTGASGTLIAHGFADLPVGASANAIFSGVHDVNTAATAGIDLTAQLFLQLTWQVSTQSGTKNSCIAHLFSIKPMD